MQTNISSNQNCNLLKSLNSFFDLFNVSQIIKVKSSSITDLIRVSDTDKVFQSDVMGIGISDHCLIFCTKKVIKKRFQ